ncbi:hypothetical protein A6P54_15055 [Bacillus sp. MKU004]|nr:hypothetical protein A6P54_15055 [Bacillus sp. MKU004]
MIIAQSGSGNFDNRIAIFDNKFKDIDNKFREIDNKFFFAARKVFNLQLFNVRITFFDWNALRECLERWWRPRFLKLSITFLESAPLLPT